MKIGFIFRFVLLPLPNTMCFRIFTFSPPPLSLFCLHCGFFYNNVHTAKINLDIIAKEFFFVPIRPKKKKKTTTNKITDRGAVVLLTTDCLLLPRRNKKIEKI